MFNLMLNAENTPLEMFSWQHFTALGIVIAIFLLVFFTRKFFIKYKLADKIFRYILGIGLITFELVLQLRHGARPLMGRFFADTYPLCGYMIWFTALALFTDSSKLMKFIYPLTLIGGSLSLIFVDMTCTFPSFGTFQFWFIHAGFMLGALYFVFTKKITRYTIKDVSNSCIFLFCLSLYVLLVASGKLMYDPNFSDPLFIIAPPGGMEGIKNTLGQAGYTIAFISIVVGLIFAIYGLTYLGTKNRKIVLEEDEQVKENIALNYLSKYSAKCRNITVLILYGIGIYMVILYRVTNVKTFLILEIISFFILYFAAVINEAVRVYSKRKKVKEGIKPAKLIEE